MSQSSSSSEENTRAGCIGFILVLVLLGWIIHSCGGDKQENHNASPPDNRAVQSAQKDTNKNSEKDTNKPVPADYDGPAKPGLGPTEVVLTVSGSEGGAYQGWVYTDRQIGPDEVLGHTDRPDFRGVIESEPTEYRFTLGHGSYKDPTGDWVWNGLNVDLKKATRGGRDWEGELNAKLLVDGKVVACSGTEPFNSLTVGWSPEKPNGGFIDKLNC